MKRHMTISLIGLVVGVWLGFMGANTSYRRDALALANVAAVQAASQMPQATSVNSSSNGASNQSQQAMAQTRDVLDRARKNPTDLNAQLQAAEQFMQIQRPDGALEFLLKAHQLKPDDAEIMADIGQSYLFLQKYDQAIEWTRRALKARPNYPLATFFLLASLVESHQHLEEAEQLLGQLDAVPASNPEFAQALAKIRQHLQTAKQEKGQTKSVLSHGPEAKD
jgi:tetratricopeptide (TPR) repeat protein